MRHLILITALVGLIAMPAAAGPDHSHRNIPETATAAGSFQGLLKAVTAAGLAGTLSGEGPFTVFAPTDAAFARLPKHVLTDLLRLENREALRNVLLAHVVPGETASTTLLFAKDVKTASGGVLPVAIRDGRLTVGGSVVSTADIHCSNGVIHVIDSVIIPPAGNTAVNVEHSPRDILRLAIDRGVPFYNDGNPGACAAVYEIAARSVVALADDSVSAEDRKTLAVALSEADRMDDPRSQAWKLRRAFDEVLHAEEGRPMAERPLVETPRAEPAFKVTLEAPLPKGFPGPGPVGKVVLKDYPSYRMARSSGGSAFGSLLMHIKKNDIAMTAPVEMTMTEKDDGELRQRDMAFLYESVSQGRTGNDGRVTVLDREPLNVLSIGLRGPLDPAKLDAASQAVEKLLTSADGWSRSGDWRLMGYNSPFIPANQRFYELQLPVRRQQAEE